MDIYQQITKSFSAIGCLPDWKEMQVLFQRVAARKPIHWMLPIWACEAVGGRRSQAIPAAVTIACCQISIILVDDMLDADPRGEYRFIGAPAAANMALAFQAAGLEAIARCEMEISSRLAALSNLYEMILTTSFGQYKDIHCPSTEAEYWQLVRTKSSPFFASALYIGALLGGGSTEVVECLVAVGKLYGEMIQIHDDLTDALEVPANPDWISGRASLPILFAQTVEHPDRQRFVDLRHQAQDTEKLAEAQTILIRCGAISYGVDQLIRRYQKCRELLASIVLDDSTGLELMLKKMIDPIEELFNAIGDTQSLFPPTSVISSGGTSGGISPN
jgi:geranylgeranyl pyrophosphate synthase